VSALAVTAEQAALTDAVCSAVTASALTGTTAY